MTTLGARSSRRAASNRRASRRSTVSLATCSPATSMSPAAQASPIARNAGKTTASIADSNRWDAKPRRGGAPWRARRVRGPRARRPRWRQRHGRMTSVAVRSPGPHPRASTARPRPATSGPAASTSLGGLARPPAFDVDQAAHREQARDRRRRRRADTRRRSGSAGRRRSDAPRPGWSGSSGRFGAAACLIVYMVCRDYHTTTLDKHSTSRLWFASRP